MDATQRTIEVAFSPRFLPLFEPEGKLIVVADILRATTVITTMLMNGAKEVIPVPDLESARSYKEKGFTVAAERNGSRLDFADFGNSPFLFTPETVGGKSIVYSTTNGTNAIHMAARGSQVLIGAFLNLTAVADHIKHHREDVLILCAGWKGKFCLEDAVYAGALSQLLLRDPQFRTDCDSVKASLDFWQLAQSNLLGYIDKVAQRTRLGKLGLDDVIGYCHEIDKTATLPVLDENHLVNINKK